MAIIYVRSTTGNNGNSGATWALAKATLAGAAAIAVAGDTIWVSQVHAESTAASVTLTFAGSKSNQTKILCGNDGAQPPTVLATTATMTVTGNSNILIQGEIYVYGITFSAGTVTSGLIAVCANTTTHQKYEQCSFLTPVSSVNSFLSISNTGCYAELKDCTVKFSNASVGISCGGRLYWNGGSVLAGGTSPTSLVYAYPNSGGWVFIENVDFSNLSSTVKFTIDPVGRSFTMRNCIMPASWSGSLGPSMSNFSRLSGYQLDNAATNYKVKIEDTLGFVDSEIVIVRNGGASDGTTPLSWKVTSNVNCAYPVGAMPTDEIAYWNDTPNVAKTLTIEYLHDVGVVSGQGSGTGFAYQNTEVWLEVRYMSSSTTPIGSLATSAPNIITAASDNPTGVGTNKWTTTGMTTPKSGKMSVTFTPLMRGFYMCKVMLGATSKIVYVDPLITVA